MNAPIPPGPYSSGNLSAAQQTELLTLMQQHRNIEAIKRYREFVPSAGLAEAKAAVETLTGSVSGPSAASSAAESNTPPMPFSPAQEQELLALLQRRQKIAAIKRYRELRPGTELMDARKAVEALAARHGIQATSNCFVATAVFGEDSPEVKVLRRWRDARLSRSAGGRVLICLYGRAGPPLAELAGRLPALKRGFQILLSRFVAHLIRHNGRY